VAAGPGSPGRAGTADPPLCPACREQIRKQEQTIPGYRLVRELGKGGMGVVYLALRGSDGSLVALKTILPEVAGTEAQVEKFLREAKILRALNHPHIVAFRDMGQARGQFFFAMDYVRGTDARGLVDRDGPLAVGRAVRLTCQLLEALEFAHGRGFVHRDIKPANLLVADPGPAEVAKLGDFGLAKVYQASQFSGLTLEGEKGGTYAFMAPEQITSFRDAKPPVDQYSTGATLYYLLTGAYVFDFAAVAHPLLLKKILEEEPVPVRERRPEVPEALAAAVHRALAKDPKERFADVKSLRKALSGFAR
jgi:serine/threonine-protein kinase